LVKGRRVLRDISVQYAALEKQPITILEDLFGGTVCKQHPAGFIDEKDGSRPMVKGFRCRSLQHFELLRSALELDSPLQVRDENAEEPFGLRLERLSSAVAYGS
jgi:hypothetical protein